MGMAEATAFDCVGTCSLGGFGDGMLAGEAIESGTMKSSKFIESGSELSVESRDSRNLAIPDGKLVGC